MRCFALRFLLLTIALPTIALADDDDDTVDPPGQVGYFSHLQGKVSLKTAAVDEWSESVLNRPLTVGDAIWSDEGGRAEIHIGSLAVRVDQFTSLRILGLDNDVVQFGLVRGRIEVTVRERDASDVLEFDLPNAAVRIQTPGVYVFSHEDDGDKSRIAARHGTVDVTINGNTIDVDAGQSALVDGDDDISYDLRAIASADEFEAWSTTRDRREDNVVATQYVPRDMTGYQQLDDYGAWQTTAEYGSIWYPTSVTVGWAPYRSGHWTYIAPWGWTWVDTMPWGFAPFHYGRWVSWRGRWGWTPGARVVHPIYSPAMVAWVGPAGGAGVGWFPLGPREVYVPAYGASQRYYQRINITHVTAGGLGGFNVATYNYVNRPNAYTMVPQQTFVGARPVGPHIIASPGGGQVITRVPYQPQRASLAPPRMAAPIRPPAHISTRPVMTVREPGRPNAPDRFAPHAQAPYRPAIPQQRSAPPRPMRNDMAPMRPASPAPSRGYNSPPQQSAPSRPMPQQQAPQRQQPSAPSRPMPQQQAPRFNPPPQAAPARPAPSPQPRPSAPSRPAPQGGAAPRR